MPSLHDVVLDVSGKVMDRDSFDRVLSENGVDSAEAVAQGDKMGVIAIESVLDETNVDAFRSPDKFLIDFAMRAKEAASTVWISGFLMGLSYAKISREGDE